MINYEYIAKQLPGGLADLILDLVTDVRTRPGKYKDLTRKDIMRWLSEEKKGKGAPEI